MRYIKLSHILEFKSPYKELIEMEAIRIMEATGGVVVPDELARLIEEQTTGYAETLVAPNNSLTCSAKLRDVAQPISTEMKMSDMYKVMKA